jgi:hypothetical protein
VAQDDAAARPLADGGDLTEEGDESSLGWSWTVSVDGPKANWTGAEGIQRKGLGPSRLSGRKERSGK